MLRCGGAPEILTSAASIPSADVPDIMPRTSMGLEVMKGRKRFLPQGAQRTQSRDDSLWRRVNHRERRKRDFPLRPE